MIQSSVTLETSTDFLEVFSIYFYVSGKV
jgi:hypothetical protein